MCSATPAGQDARSPLLRRSRLLFAAKSAKRRRRLGRFSRQLAVRRIVRPEPVVIVNLIVNVIERRVSSVDNVDDYVTCREAALIAKRSLGDDLGGWAAHIANSPYGEPPHSISTARSAHFPELRLGKSVVPQPSGSAMENKKPRASGYDCRSYFVSCFLSHFMLPLPCHREVSQKV